MEQDAGERLYEIKCSFQQFSKTLSFPVKEYKKQTHNV